MQCRLPFGFGGVCGIGSGHVRALSSSWSFIIIIICFHTFDSRFDCVYPTRTARFGVALVPSGTMRLKAKEFGQSLEKVDDECGCSTCRDCTRAYLHLMFKENNPLAPQLLSIHNIAYMMRLMRTMRAVSVWIASIFTSHVLTSCYWTYAQAILEGSEAYHNFIRNFMLRQFNSLDNVPKWALDALSHAGISL